MQKSFKFKLITFFLLFFLFISLRGQAVESDNNLNENDIIKNQLNQLNLEDLKSEINKLNQYNEDIIPELNMKELIYGLMKGDINLNFNNLLKKLLCYFGQEITVNLYLLGQVIILTVISAVFKIFHDSFSSETISQAADLIVFLILSLLLIQSFQTAMEISTNTIDNIVSFMQALLPVLLGLLIGMGAVSSAAFFKPFTFVLISFFTTVIKTIVLPLIFISCILYIVDNINNKIHISKFAKFFREISLTIVGLILITFIGILLLQGGAAAVADSLALRTARYLTGTFIPVIGGVFSDAVGLIVSCTLIIKNALNLFGVIIIILIALYPVIKLAAMIIIYKLAVVIIQPIAGNRLSKVIENLTDNLIAIFVVVLTSTFIFFVSIAVIAGVANLTVMMR